MAELDPLLGQLMRFLGSGFAIDGARIDLSVMDLARLLGEALADIVAIALDLAAEFDQCRTHLRRRERRDILVRPADIRRHQRLLDPVIAATRAGDLADLLLGLKGVAAAKPALEFVFGGAAQREPDHREGPPATLPVSIRKDTLLAIIRLECQRCTRKNPPTGCGVSHH